MRFSIHPAQTAENLKAFKSIGLITHNTRKGLRRALYHIGNSISKDAKKSILSKDKTGRIYRYTRIRREGKSRRYDYSVYQPGDEGKTYLHRASAPGESPANLSGDLQRSIGFNVRSWDRVEIGADTPYAKDLELGIGVAKRPYLIASISKNASNTKNSFIRELHNALS